MDRCKLCKGTGFVLRDTQFVCGIPHAKQTLTCMHCENVNKGKYISCENCDSTGRKRKIPETLQMKR